ILIVVHATLCKMVFRRCGFYQTILLFFNHAATTEIYTLSLHDALPIFLRHGSDKTLQVGYANHFYRSAHKFEQICKNDWRIQPRSEERFSRNAETDLVCRLLLEKKKEDV